ncbi:MAG: hypothetical protein IT385_08720 [Deltaproteobacteria bacterium]|nr:hypothetical protein [Deltaproteobacteria bacterium]
MRPSAPLRSLSLALAGLVTLAPACAEDAEAPPEVEIDENYGKPLFGVDDSVAAKADSFEGASGPPSSGLVAANAAWTVSRQWADKDDAAGLAWPARSGLTWDEKYARWIESLPKLEGGWSETFTLTTPWGKTLASPRLECAEVAIFLRFTFASWYNLPFYLTASSSAGTMYFGHFGVINKSGARVSGYPAFTRDYKDHTSAFAGKTNEQIVAAWPKDTNLRARKLSTRGDDDNSAILGPGAFTGAYLDEIFLNKRAAHLLMRVLVNFGSIHLASVQNTFNIKPSATREGDTLLERWQRSGIGHTVVVKDVTALGGDKLAIETIFGSMPRIQPTWYDTNLSKSYFTSEYTGGEGLNTDGHKYAALGGGIKRWRTPVVKSGRWYMVVPVADRAVFVDAADLVAIAARPAQFDAIMGELTPDEERDILLQRIDIARDALESRPASCSNRTRREEAFTELYELMAAEFDMSKEEVDRRYRILDDYVMPEMVYNKSKTCCWNSTTSAMYLIVMQMNHERVANEVEGQCQEPVPFYNDNGYKVFADYAASIGRGADWKAWTADESCPQATVATDTEAEHAWAPFCSVRDDVLENTDISE